MKAALLVLRGFVVDIMKIFFVEQKQIVAKQVSVVVSQMVLSVALIMNFVLVKVRMQLVVLLEKHIIMKVQIRKLVVRAV